MTTRSPEDVIDFWFVQHGRDDWFGQKPEFDARIAAEFGTTHAEVARGEAWKWRATPLGRLAEIIVLDQFSRQLFRGNARAFAQDPMALVLAQELVGAGLDKGLEPMQRIFAYLPYQHSESLVVHEEAMRLFTELGIEEALEFQKAHVACLRRFGRYPRRNAALGRESTPEELEYIASDQDRW
jgi:uncharacterized protein (DUF924 family)